MNEKVLRIFGGLPVKREPYKVELENIFGFAYSDDDGNWHKEVGSFPYLWGMYTALIMGNDFMGNVPEDQEAREIMQDFGFFILDENDKAFEIIEKFSIEKGSPIGEMIGQNTSQHGVTLVDVLGTYYVNTQKFDPQF